MPPNVDYVIILMILDITMGEKSGIKESEKQIHLKKDFFAHRSVYCNRKMVSSFKMVASSSLRMIAQTVKSYCPVKLHII